MSNDLAGKEQSAVGTSAAASTERSRLRDWWIDGFGWCRFLGHRYEPVEGCCIRCGGIPADVWEGEGYGD